MCESKGGGMETENYHDEAQYMVQYFVFIVNLSTRINKQFNQISVTSLRSTMKSCLTIL